MAALQILAILADMAMVCALRPDANPSISFLPCCLPDSTAGHSMPHTVTLHRVLACPPNKIYRAFTEADAMARWLPPNGFTCQVQAMDVRAGGRFKMSFTNFTTGSRIGFGGEYLELVPGERLRYNDVFDDANLPGVMEVTVTLREVSVGTELTVVQAGVPEVIPLEACYLGWQESLRNLARLVEPNIPD
jgi:uncharacterized protein YndB with AHSA1/START domain